MSLYSREAKRDFEKRFSDELGEHIWNTYVLPLQKEKEELKAANAELLEALKEALPYVVGAYECAFPDEQENEYIRDKVSALITKHEI